MLSNGAMDRDWATDTDMGSMPKRLLIFGINYWPEETGIAPYTTGLAEHLAALGMGVTVVAGLPYYPAWRVAEEYRGRWRPREHRHGVDIHRFRQYVPSRQSATRRACFEASFLAQGLTAWGIPRPDAVLGILPNLSDGVLAALAARRFRVPLGLLIQDLVGQAAAQSGITGGRRVAGVTSAVEGWVARQANGVAVVAAGFQPKLEQLGVEPRRITRVRNWTHIKPATQSPAATRAQLGLPADRPIILHAGNMGLKQGLDNVVACARLALTTAPELHFVLMGDGNQRPTLEARARGLLNVQFLPPQPDHEFPNVLAAADVLLVNQRPSVIDMSLPGKLTSYFASGRPVVAAVSQESETARELGAARAGVVVDAGQPGALLAAAQRLIADPALAAELGERGRVFAEAHLSEAAALARLDGFLVELCGGRPTQSTLSEAIT